MKLLRMRLANWLTQGGYLAACKAATKLEADAQAAEGRAEKHWKLYERTERHLRIAENALIEKDERINKLSDDNTRMSEGLDRIIRAGEGRIEGPRANGSLRKVVRIAEGALFPAGVPQEMSKDREQSLRIDLDRTQTALTREKIARHQGEMPL